jgi:hypothetical protein
MTDSKIESAKKLLANGIPPRDVAKNHGVSIPTLYRWIPAAGADLTVIWVFFPARTSDLQTLSTYAFCTISFLKRCVEDFVD